MRRSALLALAIAFLLCFGVLVGCGGVTPTTPQPTAQEAYQAFVKQLRAAGAVVVETPQKPLSEFSGEVHQLLVNGSQVNVFAYATAEDASDDAAHLSPDGGTFQRGNSISISEWAAPPHFYKKNQLIVLYVGSDSQMLTLLISLLGPQFAGW